MTSIVNTADFDGTKYATRHNWYSKRKGARPTHLLISCCYGHPITCIKLDTTWGGSNDEMMVSNDLHVCHDCEQEGRTKINRRRSNG